MVDCVFNAFVAHLTYLDLPLKPEVRICYDGLRSLSGHQKEEATFAGIVPTLGIMIAALYDIDWLIEQNKEFDLFAQASALEKSYMASIPEKLSITNGPGIYCGYFSAHALFSETLPDGDVWVLSIKLRRYSK